MKDIRDSLVSVEGPLIGQIFKLWPIREQLKWLELNLTFTYLKQVKLDFYWFKTRWILLMLIQNELNLSFTHFKRLNLGFYSPKTIKTWLLLIWTYFAKIYAHRSVSLGLLQETLCTQVKTKLTGSDQATTVLGSTFLRKLPAREK